MSDEKNLDIPTGAGPVIELIETYRGVLRDDFGVYVSAEHIAVCMVSDWVAERAVALEEDPDAEIDAKIFMPHKDTLVTGTLLYGMLCDKHAGIDNEVRDVH